jgi:transposase-like protein
MPERGVTLSDIAKEHGVSLSELRAGLLKARKKSYVAKVSRAAPYGRAGRGGRMAY